MVVIIVDQKLTREDLKKIAEDRYGDLVKAVVDISQRIIAIGGELHADEEAALLAQGSHQNDLWGINLYPDSRDENWIEFDSMINIRPSCNNRSRGVEDEAIRRNIRDVVNLWIE